MAYGIKQISPIDLKPSIALGVKIPFTAANVFSSVYTTKEQTKYNIINYLLTDRNERPFNNNFGAGLRSRLFEQISDKSLNDFELSLTSQIEQNFPEIEVTDLNVTGDPDNLSFTVEFSYRLLRINENDSVIIMIQNA
jgi:hypothetical protein